MAKRGTYTRKEEPKRPPVRFGKLISGGKGAILLEQHKAKPKGGKRRGK